MSDDVVSSFTNKNTFQKRFLQSIEFANIHRGEG